MGCSRAAGDRKGIDRYTRGVGEVPTSREVGGKGREGAVGKGGFWSEGGRVTGAATFFVTRW